MAQASKVTDIIGKTLVPDDEVRRPAMVESFLCISGVRAQGKNS
jgi:hypothetical protein